jgi:hypothetical protein
MFLGREFLLSGELFTLTSKERIGQYPREVQFFQALFLRTSGSLSQDKVGPKALCPALASGYRMV